MNRYEKTGAAHLTSILLQTPGLRKIGSIVRMNPEKEGKKEVEAEL